MLIVVNKKDKEKFSDQIYHQIKRLIDNGALEPGAKLPSSRELAKTTGVNRTTVVHAYEDLWAEGYIESTPGSYTTVRKRKSALVTGSGQKTGNDPLLDFYADCIDLAYGPISHYLENGEQIEKGKINLLQLSPDTRLLDMKLIKACMRQVLNENSINPFNYTHARGYFPLRREISRHMRLHSVYTDDKNVMVTNGSLQSLQLIFQTFSKPGDYIVTEDPTNSIILHIIKIFGLKLIGIPITRDGIDLKILKKVLKEAPVRFIYIMPTFQNPTGISMPQSNREEFLRICKGKNCIIIEDSIEEEMKYSGKSQLPIKSIDHKDQVIYLGTFAKVLAPGLKIGWLTGSEECVKKLSVMKSILEISSGSINQIFLHRFIVNGAFELHIRKTMRIFRKRMRAAVVAIKKYIPAEMVEWEEPSGGYMIWMKLLCPKMENIEKHLANYGVMVHNGRYFFVKDQPFDYIRICISQSDEHEIEEGIKRIGTAIKALS
jgi:DNA-binding transcriptional MocR family regulator